MTMNKEMEKTIRNAIKEGDNALLNEFFKGLTALGINISIYEMTPITGIKRVLTMENKVNGNTWNAALEFTFEGFPDPEKINIEEILRQKERNAYQKLKDAKDEWIDLRIKLDGHQIARKVDVELLDKILKIKTEKENDKETHK